MKTNYIGFSYSWNFDKRVSQFRNSNYWTFSWNNEITDSCKNYFYNYWSQSWKNNKYHAT